ncbi:hypothetical protein [Leptolyngbya sp. FACHB-16]|uniref:hypothetical protein n=1 Tax=unclassified Leptolyngbya TaxID=2650499 RepID=UPI0016828D0D|nr:hypothetical protein [Leptolyngbya sp. FACHB-16]MBD1912869.1 hypothetical protein [Leptolyngbya sp. FACHB-8]MBD2157480.1 hypothetical protein [Leptolyngbya sp. FACHB-16]
MNEQMKGVVVGAVFLLATTAFVYEGIAEDKQLSEQVILVTLAGLGSFGAGYALGRSF